MTPYFQDQWTQLYNGDCREVLKSLPSESVSMVCTSPPYWSLRNYGIPPSVWGGDASCAHVWSDSMAQGRVGWESTPEGQKQFKAAETDAYKSEYKFCLLCDAWLGCLGLEPTLEMFINNLVEVFREVKRVLKADGTLWLNMGDSYARQAGDDSTKATDSGMKTGRTGRSSQLFKAGTNKPPPGLKPKDLCMIPHRLAIALQMDGWYVRSDIVWHKPNPMPESVTDRPTKSHEYIFLLSKSEQYFYNAEAIKEPLTRPEELERKNPAVFGGANKHAGYGTRLHSGNPYTQKTNGSPLMETRNKRSVWTIATKPYPESHFAVFPPDLIRPCILAGCPVGGTVLDPFAGSGTTLQVAREAQCKSIGIELSADYCKLIEKRLQQGVLNFAAG